MVFDHHIILDLISVETYVQLYETYLKWVK